eukprot:m.22593 g.22593  ORF g.22593 m.22593 type:complete len:405 (+) comp9244_c0_seq1:318-1532(+)
MFLLIRLHTLTHSAIRQSYALARGQPPPQRAQGKRPQIVGLDRRLQASHLVAVAVIRGGLNLAEAVEAFEAVGAVIFLTTVFRTASAAAAARPLGVKVARRGKGFDQQLLGVDGGLVFCNNNLLVCVQAEGQRHQAAVAGHLALSHAPDKGLPPGYGAEDAIGAVRPAVLISDCLARLLHRQAEPHERVLQDLCVGARGPAGEDGHDVQLAAVGDSVIGQRGHLALAQRQAQVVVCVARVRPHADGLAEDFPAVHDASVVQARHLVRRQQLAQAIERLAPVHVVADGLDVQLLARGDAAVGQPDALVSIEQLGQALRRRVAEWRAAQGFDVELALVHDTAVRQLHRLAGLKRLGDADVVCAVRSVAAERLHIELHLAQDAAVAKHDRLAAPHNVAQGAEERRGR